MQAVYTDTFGQPGFPGPDGAPGPSGATGPSGIRGVRGPVGPSGSRGPSGMIGPSGPIGFGGPTFIPSVVNPIGPSGFYSQTIAVVGGPSGVSFTNNNGLEWSTAPTDEIGFELVNCIASTTYTTSDAGQQPTRFVIGGIGSDSVLYTDDFDNFFVPYLRTTEDLNTVFSFECSKVIWSAYYNRFIAVGINEVLTGPDTGRRSIVSAYSANALNWSTPTTEIPRGPSPTALDQPYGSGRGIVSDLKCNGRQTIVTANGIILTINSILRSGPYLIISKTGDGTFNTEFREGDKFMLNRLVPSNPSYISLLNYLTKTLLTVGVDTTSSDIRIELTDSILTGIPGGQNLITFGEAYFPDNNWYCVSNDGGTNWGSSRQIIVDPSSIPGGIIPAWDDTDMTYMTGDIVFHNSSYVVPNVAQAFPCQYWRASTSIGAGTTPGGSPWYPAIWTSSIIYSNFNGTNLVWYDGYPYTLKVGFSQGNIPDSSPTVWQKGTERDIRNISSNITVSSVAPYYDYNSWSAFFTNENYYNGRSGTALITNAGTTTPLVRGLNLYATITNTRQFTFPPRTLFQYTVNGRSDIDLFSVSPGVYFSDTTPDALLKNIYFKFSASAGEVTVYGTPPASFTYMMPAGIPLGFTTSTAGAFDGKNWVIAGVDTDSSSIVAAPTIEDGISANIPGSLFTENTKLDKDSRNILWQNIVWTGNVFMAYGQEVEDITYYYTTSKDGISWTPPEPSPISVISDICFTPNTVTLAPNIPEYSRVFLSSNTIFSGSLTLNDYIHVKNISAQSIEIFGTPGINGAELQLSPSKSSDYAGSSALVSYRGGPSGSYLYVE